MLFYTAPDSVSRIIRYPVYSSLLTFTLDYTLYSHATGLYRNSGKPLTLCERSSVVSTLQHRVTVIATVG